MKDVFISGGLEGLGDYDYENGSDIQSVDVKFKSDWAKEY